MAIEMGNDEMKTEILLRAMGIVMSTLKQKPIS